MKKLGFGFMRLPKLEDGEVDIVRVNEMVDAYMGAGFTYFDTAHNYIGGRSEKAIRECLTSRYPRESYVLTDKLTRLYFEKEEDIRPVLDEELAICGVEYFDYLLLHAVGSGSYEKLERCNAFGQMVKFREDGKTRHIGMSFHDTPEFLDRVLTEHPELEIVQIQFNYLDVGNPGIQSRGVYEVCRKHGKPVLVMEPVKGGALADLPAEAAKFLDDLNGGSHASYAIRYAASQEGVVTVLSGMSTLEQVQDNIGYMSDFRPLDEKETAAVDQVREFLLGQEMIGCTTCRYCMDKCPQQIPIPEIFTCYNKKKKYLAPSWIYQDATKDKAKASDCLECGLCEEACPQKLEIRKLLKQAAEMFE